MTIKQLSLSKHWKRLEPAADLQPPRPSARQRIATRIGELHEEFTEAPLLAVMLILSFHSIADGAIATGFVTDRWLARLFAFGIDYTIWAGYRRIRQGYPLGWVLVIPGSFATVGFQTFLIGKGLTPQHWAVPLLVVLGFFVMERVRRARMVAAIRDVGGHRVPVATGLERSAPTRQPDPVPDGLRPGRPLGPVAGLVETDSAALEDAPVEPAPLPQLVPPSGRPGLAATPRPVTRRPAVQVTPADLDRAVETYSTTPGRAKAKRAAVLELRLAPWKVVEAELKARDLIGSNGVRVNGSHVTATPANGSGNGGGQ